MNLTKKQEKEYFRLQGVDEAENELGIANTLQRVSGNSISLASIIYQGYELCRLPN